MSGGVTGARGLGTTTIGGRSFRWGERTFVMGIVNATPDSFSGDGLLAGAPADPVAAAVALARPDGRRGRRPARRRRRIHPARPRAGRRGGGAGPGRPRRRRAPRGPPRRPDQRRHDEAAVAAAALDAGAALINDVWGVGPDDGARPARRRARRADRADAQPAPSRATTTSWPRWSPTSARRSSGRSGPAAGGSRSSSTRASGSARPPEHNLAILRDLGALRALGRPILLGTSRKSTLGRVLDLPAERAARGDPGHDGARDRAGADIVRVHDVGPNVRVARMTDAIVRGWTDPAPSAPAAPGGPR